MKATLEFNLPEEQYEFDCAVRGQSWKGAVSLLDNYLRNESKYSNREVVSTQEVREKLFEILREQDLELD
jgi:hypothetical protein